MRPGKGNTGKPCIVKAIHFFAALPDKDLHQYDVTITPTNKIVEGQQSSKRLSERQITALLKVTCQRPLEREKDILRTVALNNYKDYPYSKEFGIKISTSLASVEARILPPPWLKYHDSGREGTCFPQVGQWNMMNKKMINGGTVNNWFCIIFSSQVQDNLARTFCQELGQMCYVSGIGDFVSFLILGKLVSASTRTYAKDDCALKGSMGIWTLLT